MSGKTGVVSEMMDRIKKFLEASRTSDAASVTLYVLSLMSCYIGRDNQEEAELFKKGWDDLKSTIEQLTSLDEFVSAERFIETSIIQVLHPDRYPNSSHREKSSLVEKKDFVLKYLKI